MGLSKNMCTCTAVRNFVCQFSKLTVKNKHTYIQRQIDLKKRDNCRLDKEVVYVGAVNMLFLDYKGAVFTRRIPLSICSEKRPRGTIYVVTELGSQQSLSSASTIRFLCLLHMYSYKGIRMYARPTCMFFCLPVL